MVGLRAMENVLFFQEFEYTFDLFSAFSSVFIRLYLNLTINCLENLLCRIVLTDKNKIIKQILKHANMIFGKLWNKTNSNFFHDFLICLIR